MTPITQKILYGGDYNPDQWLDQPEILKQDLELMKKAQINTVTLGVFSWSALEPREGEYTFDWMENQINRLYDNGISVILATPSGARPKWMADRYPEVLRVDEERRRQLFGFRHNHCYTSPVYRDKVRQMNRELARRFGNHPAVILWHISNEYGGECHCPLCQDAFRAWLKERYGTIERLNHCWNTSFWSHIYQDFEQVESPSSIGEMKLHGLTLDWKRFVTAQTVDFVRAEIEAIREGGSDKPATANLMYNYDGLNYHRFSDVIDVVSWDTYPTWHKGPEYLTAMDSGMQHDLMRGILKKPFLLMESCPSSTNWQSVSKLKRPGMLKAASLQALAHGSDSVLYFQIRQSRGASEKFHGAVIDHYGKEDTRVFSEVRELGDVLERLGEIRGSETRARAALVYDRESIWAMNDADGPRNKDLHYKEAVEKSYFALRRCGLDVDVIDTEQSLSDYQVVAAPMVYLFRHGFEVRVKEFTAAGGTFIMTYWSGIVDETDLCFLGGTPHGLIDVLGLRSEEIDGLYDGETNTCTPVIGNLLGMEKNYLCENLCDLVRTTTAQPVMVYGEDFYAGKPVFTYNRYEKGEAWYIAADMERGFYEEAFRKILLRAGITGLWPKGELPLGVWINSRQNDMYRYYFVQNFNKEAVTLLQPEGWELLEGGTEEGNTGWGNTEGGNTYIPGLGTWVFRERI